MRYTLLVILLLFSSLSNAEYFRSVDRGILRDFDSPRLSQALTNLTGRINSKRASAMCMELLKKEVIPNAQNLNYDPNVDVLTVKGSSGVTVYTSEGMVDVKSNIDLSCQPNSDTSSKFIRNWISSFSGKLTANSDLAKARAINFYCSQSHDSVIRQASNGIARVINSRTQSVAPTSNTPAVE